MDAVQAGKAKGCPYPIQALRIRPESNYVRQTVALAINERPLAKNGFDIKAVGLI